LPESALCLLLKKLMIKHLSFLLKNFLFANCRFRQAAKMQKIINISAAYIILGQKLLFDEQLAQ